MTYYHVEFTTLDFGTEVCGGLRLFKHGSIKDVLHTTRLVFLLFTFFASIMIPRYFHDIFKSVQTLPEYLGLDFDELDLCAEDKSSLNELSQQILIATSNTTGDIYKSEIEFIPRTDNGTMEDV